MLRNGDISYSTIAPNQGSQCLCCFCSCKCSLKSCLKSCILRLPYGTLLSTIISICGLAIIAIFLTQSTLILDRLLLDLLHRKYLWFNYLKVIYIVFCLLILVIILINLAIGWMTTGLNLSYETKKNSRGGCRVASCIIRTVFVVNNIIFYLVFLCTLLSVVILYTSFIVSGLCKDKKTMVTSISGPQTTSEHQLDLTLFASMLKFEDNEKNLLIFEDFRLKQLCVDYMTYLYPYALLYFIGFILLTIGFLNFLINLGVNWTRISVDNKYYELLCTAALNSAEMADFVQHTEPLNSRF